MVLHRHLLNVHKLLDSCSLGNNEIYIIARMSVEEENLVG